MKANLDFYNKTNLDWLKANTIYLCIHGSNAYGVATEESDIDIRGIAVPPKSYYFGINNSFEQATFKENDVVIFSLKKFFYLAAQGNPNALEILFVEPEERLLETPLFQKLLEKRDLFLSKKIKHTMMGYAHSQLSRITSHRRWLLNPLEKPPTRKEFGLPEKMLLPEDQLMAIEAIIQKQLDSWNLNLSGLEPARVQELQEQVTVLCRELGTASIFLNKENLYKEACVSVGLDSNFIDLVNKEKQFKSKKADWDSYLQWKANRNPKRAEMEKQFGYDLKHASHLYRLTSQCEEVLKYGRLTLKNQDRIKMIKEIKAGMWTYDSLLEYFSNKELEMDELYKSSIIPKSVDMLELDNLLMSMTEEFLYGSEYDK